MLIGSDASVRGKAVATYDIATHIRSFCSMVNSAICPIPIVLPVYTSNISAAAMTGKLPFSQVQQIYA